MKWINRVLAWWFPSVPPADQARVLAAMEGRTPSPAPDVCGEAASGAGQTPEGEVTESSLVTEAYLNEPRPPVHAGEDLRYWREQNR